MKHSNSCYGLTNLIFSVTTQNLLQKITKCPWSNSCPLSCCIPNLFIIYQLLAPKALSLEFCFIFFQELERNRENAEFNICFNNLSGNLKVKKISCSEKENQESYHISMPRHSFYYKYGHIGAVNDTCNSQNFNSC